MHVDYTFSYRRVCFDFSTLLREASDEEISTDEEIVLQGTSSSLFFF